MRTPVIDFHNHVGRYGHLAMDDDPERFVRIMDAAGVDRACVFCIWYGDARRANDMTARLVATHPGRFIGAAYVTPNYPEEMLPELERAFYMPGMKYVKLYPAYHAGRVIDDPVFFPVFEWADARGLAVMSHHNDWPQPLRYVGLAKRYPNVRWVIAHAGNGPMAQEDAVRAAKSADNVYLEASTSWGDHGTIKFLVEGAGEDRVLFGSDMPEQDARYQVGRVATADISDEAKRKVLGLNAIEVLGLGRDGGG